MVDTEHIQIAHGGGGQLTAELVAQVILPALGDASAQDAGGLTDAAIIQIASGDGELEASRIAFTTDSYVVQPLEFPGGDIGKLAICGTVNDLAVVGARPKVLSLALVLEEGLEIALLRRVLESAGRAAVQAGVKVITGDTKVVERGGVAGMVINTAGVGQRIKGAELGFKSIREGDRIILSGPLGEHGMAVMSRRKGLSFSAQLASDCAPLNGLTGALLAKLGPAVRFMRDPTRGGLAATAVEIATASGRDIELVEDSIPINRTARAAAEMLGLDLLTIANEGKLVAVISSDAADEAVRILRRDEIARSAAVVGTVGAANESPLVELVTHVGGRRVVQMPYGEELPRIC
ncbi:MAG: hydrogenase expression/formation protein HypE [Phycisphaerae bacterium]